MTPAQIAEAQQRAREWKPTLLLSRLGNARTFTVTVRAALAGAAPDAKARRRVITSADHANKDLLANPKDGRKTVVRPMHSHSTGSSLASTSTGRRDPDMRR